MSPRSLLFRSLVYHRAVNLAVVAGVAIGVAVLAGAFLVGDSVRGSLRDLTLDRLGAVDHALLADRYFRSELADELDARTVPAILIRGSAEAPEGGRASQVNLHGVDEAFWALFEGVEAPQLGVRDVALNESLARELGVQEGDAVLLRFQTDTLVPSESVMGRKTDNVRTLRLTAKTVLPNRGPGRFGLSPSQQLPLNAFLPLAALQRALDQPGRANALLAGSQATLEAAAALNANLKERLQLQDAELEVHLLGGQGSLAVNTGRIVLEPVSSEAALEAAEEGGLTATPIITYLANTIEVNGREIPYSTVTALAPAPETLWLRGGDQAPELSGNELLLNDWAARHLGARTGDEVTLSYFVVGPRGELVTQRHTFTLAGVVAMDGVALDRSLAPEYEGMSDVDRIGDWDPPFPVDLTRIREVDEDYWDQYRTAPKAFVALAKAKALWTSRFGQLTSIRLSPPEGVELGKAHTDYVAALRGRLQPAQYGLAFQPVKAQGLEASSGATDFSGLFVGFSMFLIASAALLVTLLFRLGVERRAREVGLLLATGSQAKRIRGMLFAEGAILAAAGALIGLPAAVGYGALMVHGLRTWWSAAVGGSFLELHVTVQSLAIGAVSGVLLMLGAIWLAVRRLEKLSPRAMLAGALTDDDDGTASERARRPRLVAAVCAVTALALFAGSFGVDAGTRTALFFGVGALSLVATLAWYRARLLKPQSRSSVGGSAPLWRLGSGNTARYPTRSVLSAALVASAAFVIVVVALMRHDVRDQEPNRNSGDGGFRFIAQSDLPLHQEDLADENGVFALRVKQGEDASCLNLYRPGEPTLLGAPPGLIERGGFQLQSVVSETDAEQANPWLVLDREFPEDAIPVFGDLNSVMWILHLGVGDTLEVEDGLGRRRKLVIAGLMPRSIFQSELVMSEKNFLDLFPDHSGYNMLLVETDNAEAGQALEDRWADLGLDATTTADRLASFLVVENTYLSTFQTLGGLGLLLGTFGLAIVMVRNVLERRRELALLQAVGFRPRSISRVVLAENASLLLFGMLAGVGTALLAAAPQLGTSSAEPPWASLLMTLTLIVAAGLLAGAVAVGASLRQPLLPNLRRD